MQQRIELREIPDRVQKAARWQDHERLCFEVFHWCPQTGIRVLAAAYRAELTKSPTPLMRWAFADLTMALVYYNSFLDGRLFLEYRTYGIKRSDFWDEPQIFEELRRVVKEAPKNVMGYLGLARAYGAALRDPEIAKYEKIVGESETTIEINGRQQRVKVLEGYNPERRRRYRYYIGKVREIDPQNPYLPWRQIGELERYLVSDHRHPELEFYVFYDAKYLKSLTTQEIRLECLKLAKAAYERGLAYNSPISALGEIVYQAWLAGRQEEAKQWGEKLKTWIAQSRESLYIPWLRKMYGHSCPYILELLR